MTQPSQQRRERPSRAKDPAERQRAFEESKISRDTGGKFSTSGQGSSKESGLGIGAQGPAVTRLQEALRRAGYNIPATGYFGPETARALKDYQTGLGLKPTGTLNVQTLNVLAKYFNQDLSKAKDEGGVKKPGGGGSSKGSGTSAADKAKRLKAAKAKAKLSIERAQDALEIQKAALAKQQAQVGQHDDRIKELEKAADTSSGATGLTPKGVKELRTLRARKKMQELEVRISKARVKRASNEVKRRTKEMNAITGSADLSPFVFDYTMGYDYGPPVGHNFPQALLADLILDEPEPVEEHESAVIVCRTSADDPVNALVVDDDPHVTMAYLSPDMSTDELDQILDSLRSLAKQCTPIETEVNGRGRLGDHDAAVLLLEDVALSCLHDSVVADPVVAYQMSMVEQYPEWTPHITLGYGNDFLIEITDPGHLPSTVTFDTISLWIGESKFDFAFTGAHDDPDTVSMKVTHGPNFMDEKVYLTVDDEAGNNVMYAALAHNDSSGWEKLGLFNGETVEAIIAAPAFEEWEHPRGADGRFINKFGIIKFLQNGKWKYGQVKDIFKGSDGKAKLAVQPSDLSGTPTPGEKELTLNPNQVYRAPKKIAHLTKDEPGATKVGGQGGSNEGGLYSIPDPAGGPAKKFYVKKPKSQDHGRVEELSNDLYAAAGVAVPNVDYDGKNIYSEIVAGEELSQTIQQKLNDKEWLTQIRKNFVVDAWLANWDVFGLSWDNMLVDNEGTTWRIDNGGALTYRAQGSPKGDAFGDKVGELESMRTGKNAPIYGKGNITKEDELDGAVRVLAISPEEIDDLVAERGLPQSMADTLKSRRKYIADFYGLPLPEAAKPIDVPDVAENDGLSRKWFPMPLSQATTMSAPGDYIRIGSHTNRIGVNPDGSLMNPVQLQAQQWDLLDKYGPKANVHYQSPLTNLNRPHDKAVLNSTDLSSVRWERGDKFTDPYGDVYEVHGVSPAKGQILVRPEDTTYPMLIGTHQLETGVYTVHRWDPSPEAAKEPDLPEVVPVPEPEVEVSEPPQKTGMAAPVETAVKEEIKAAAEAKPAGGEKNTILGDGTEASPGAKVVSKKDGNTYSYVKKKGPYSVVKNADGVEALKLSSSLTQPGATPAANVPGAKTPLTGDGKVPQLGMTAVAKDGHQGKIVMISPDGKFVFIEDAAGKRKRKSVGTVTITSEPVAVADIPEPDPVELPAVPDDAAVVHPVSAHDSSLDDAKPLAAWIDSGVLKIGHKVTPASAPDHTYEVVAFTDLTVQLKDDNDKTFTVLKTVLNDFTVDTTPTVLPESAGVPESAAGTGPNGGPMVNALSLKPGDSVHQDDGVVVVTHVDDLGNGTGYVTFSNGTIGTYVTEAPLTEKTETSIFDEDGAYLPAHQIFPNMEAGDEFEHGGYTYIVIENNLMLGGDKTAVVSDAVGDLSTPILFNIKDFPLNENILVKRHGADYIDAELTQGQIDKANAMVEKLKAGPGTPDDHKLTGNQGQDAAGWALSQNLKYDDATYPIQVSESGFFWRRHTTAGWQMWTNLSAPGGNGAWLGDGPDAEPPPNLKQFHTGVVPETLTLPNGYEYHVMPGEQVAKVGNNFYVASPTTVNWYLIDGDYSVDTNVWVSKYNSDGTVFPVDVFHDPFSTQVDVVDITPAVPDQLATGDKINSFYEVGSWESVVYISDSSTYYIQASPGKAWWPITSEGTLGKASISHHVMSLVPEDKRFLVHQAEGDPPPFPTEPTTNDVLNNLLNAVAVSKGEGLGGTFDGYVSQPNDVVVKTVVANEDGSETEKFFVKSPGGDGNFHTVENGSLIDQAYEEATIKAFLANSIAGVKMEVAQGSFDQYDATTAPDLSGSGPVSPTPQKVDVGQQTGSSFYDGWSYELQPGESLYISSATDIAYVSAANPVDPNDPPLYELNKSGVEVWTLVKSSYAEFGADVLTFPTPPTKVELKGAPAVVPKSAASSANVALGAPHPSTMTLTTGPTIGDLGLVEGDWLYVDFGSGADPQYMKATSLPEGGTGWGTFEIYEVDPTTDTAVKFAGGVHSIQMSDTSPLSAKVYSAKAQPPPPPPVIKPELPAPPTEDESLSWGGAHTKDGYIPAVDMHVTGKGPMHGKIVSISKNKQNAVVLTSTGEKSNRLISALSLDTNEYSPIYHSMPALPVPKGMALAVDAPAEALGKTLKDGQYRAIVTDSPGIRYGEMVTARGIGPSGKKYNRVIFALTNEQRLKLSSDLASGGATPPTGDWVKTKKPTGDIAVGEQLALRPSHSTKVPGQWRYDDAAEAPTHKVTAVDTSPDGALTVTFESLADGSVVSTGWSPGYTYGTIAWDPNKVKVVPAGTFTLGQAARDRGWTEAKDGGISAMDATGKLDVEPGQTVPTKKSGFPDFSSSHNVRFVAKNGVVIEVIEPSGSYSDSRFGMTTISLPEGSTDGDLSAALAELGLGSGYSPMTQDSAKQQVRTMLSTMISWDKKNVDNAQGFTDAEMFKAAGDQMGIPDLGWQDVRVGVDESVGKVSFFWSDRAINAMKTKSKMNLVIKASGSGSADTGVSVALNGQMNSMNKRINGAVYAPGGSGLGVSATSDSGKYSGHGTYLSSTKASKLPSHNTQASYAGSSMITYHRPEALFGRIGDMRTSQSDAFGNPGYGEENYLKNVLTWGSVKDYYVSGGVTPEQTSLIAMQSQKEVDSAIAKLKAKGIVSINGIPIEKYIVTLQQAGNMHPDDLPPLYLPPNIRPIVDLPQSYEV